MLHESLNGRLSFWTLLARYVQMKPNCQIYLRWIDKAGPRGPWRILLTGCLAPGRSVLSKAYLVRQRPRFFCAHRNSLSYWSLWCHRYWGLFLTGFALQNAGFFIQKLTVKTPSKQRNPFYTRRLRVFSFTCYFLEMAPFKETCMLNFSGTQNR